MPGWKGSTRRSRLPPDWHKRRKRRLEMDGYRCTVILEDGSRCPNTATEVDHSKAMTDDHQIEELRSMCEPHHATKSGQEGAAARAALLARARKKFVRTEGHPGLL